VAPIDGAEDQQWLSTDNKEAQKADVWKCDLCRAGKGSQESAGSSSPKDLKCKLCDQILGDGIAKVCEGLLTTVSSERSWCHLSCVRWHVEIAVSATKEYLFTDKKLNQD
jgi:hypothetical protein